MVTDFVSPLTGTMLDLSQVPDQVFADRILGDGFACDLKGNVVTAPFDGEVISLFPTGHAVALKDEQGREVMIHIGIDTVKLKGNGFKPLVSVGQRVKRSDALLELDLEALSHAKSVISPVVFTSGQKIELLKENEEIINGEGDIIVIFQEGS